MQNRDRQFVLPDDLTFKAAAAGADWVKTPGMGVILTDQPGKASWPMTGASFILMHIKQDKPEQGRAVIKFFDWAFKNGAAMADELDYVPVPATVIPHIQSQWKRMGL
jgi:phosphate transport system substrate-binding protein